MSLLAFARSQKERPMRQPGQKAVTGRVASHTQHRLVPSAGPHALDFPSMTRPETGRGDDEVRSDGARRPPLPVGISPARGEIARRAAFANFQGW